MTPSGEMSGQHETARQQSKAAWSAVAAGWYAQREELWKASRPVGEWMKAPSRYFQATQIAECFEIFCKAYLVY